MSHVCNYSSGKEWMLNSISTLLVISSLLNMHIMLSEAHPSEEVVKDMEVVELVESEKYVAEIYEVNSVGVELETIASTPITHEVTLEVIEREEPEYLYYYVVEPETGKEYYLDTSYQDYLYEMCVEYNVVEYYTLFIALMYHESRFDPNAISRTNDYGLMQINEGNHEWLSETLGVTDFLDPYQSIRCGVFMLSSYLHKYDDVQKALVCYNKGEGAVIDGTYSTDYSQCVVSDLDKLVELNN